MGRVPPQGGWAGRVFGAQVETLRERIPRALAAAHARARDAHDSAGTLSRRVYGTALWERQHAELIAAITPLEGARVATLGGYQLAVLAGHAFFPLHYADRVGIAIDKARLRKPVSDQRVRLFGAHGAEVAHAQPLLDETWADLYPAQSYPAFPQLGADTQLIVVAYACSMESGLLNLGWGQAEHRGDGELEWGEHESLPLPASAGPAAGARQANVLSVVPDDAGEEARDDAEVAASGGRFDRGDEPGIVINLRPPSERAFDAPPESERRPGEPDVRDHGQS
ncbi:hypothetical protein [Actinopolymorpha alba]|uniref:hypothetical protein n=1 Tax=Actinopolymorpha alba TaxID=533267 RepID=UPI00035E8551|nr:hypothetical protein [Actinopolymorpha alba]